MLTQFESPVPGAAAHPFTRSQLVVIFNLVIASSVITIMIGGSLAAFGQSRDSESTQAVSEISLLSVEGDHFGVPPSDLFVSRSDLWSPVLYTTGWHLVGMGVLLSMDREATGFKPPHIRNVVQGVTSPPVWDEDKWYTNLVGHPLWGSETYLVVRRDGHSRWRSFLFSTGASVVWEVAIEGWAEQPSIQDFLLTSTLGSVLGELRYRAIASLAYRQDVWSKVTLVLADPVRMLTNLTGLSVDVGLAFSPVRE